MCLLESRKPSRNTIVIALPYLTSQPRHIFIVLLH